MNDLMGKLSPMLFYEEEVFDSKDYIYELKLDGLRALAYIYNNHVVLVNKRQKDITATYPELGDIYKNVKKECILDGEIVVMDKGKPNFFHLQKRALMTNTFKLKLAIGKHPVTFFAFDILYCHDKLLIDEPLIKRKEILKDNIIETKHLVMTRYIEKRGKDFFELAKIEDLEGIVAKVKDSKYYPGKKSRVWLKMKVYQETDLIICGYVPSENGIKDIILGDYDSNNQLFKVATIMTSKDKNIIIDFARTNPSKPLFAFDNDEVIWLKPHLVGTVKYMMKTNSGGLRQAVFKGIRNDKVASDLKN